MSSFKACSMFFATCTAVLKFFGPCFLTSILMSGLTASINFDNVSFSVKFRILSSSLPVGLTNLSVASVTSSAKSVIL
ncbi:unnamed protein product [Larinioides sclopetarius]|uniref:Secreted protein n=1 Tax=Larinioides sclopetarius TaxID=280406 RepID=A0AAV1ZA38_9ARAC